MAYSTSNPPRLLLPSLGGGQQVWGYKSTHTSTEALATNFFTNGAALGMRAGDVLLVSNSTSGVPFLAGIVTVNASSAATAAGSTGA